MNEWKINDEQRITLNLSTLARSVVEQDMLEFNSRSLSDFVCRVFENFYQTASASIGRTLNREEGHLLSTLETKRIPQDISQRTISILISEREAKLVDIHSNQDKSSETQNIRLQNLTIKTIMSCQRYESKYYPRISSYVKAVIEEYCRLPYIRREWVYFKQYFNIITGAMQANRQLEVTVQDGRHFLVHPCRIMTDNLDSAYYLAGFSRFPGEKISEKVPASFRISSLVDVILLDDPAYVSGKDQTALDKKIDKRGVQFLLSQETLIRVRLTPNGQLRLRRMTALRPRCKKQEGDIYTFECTELQAEYYFTSMGADCEVLEPLSLRSKFADIYINTAKIYSV